MQYFLEPSMDLFTSEMTFFVLGLELLFLQVLITDYLQEYKYI